MSLKAVVAQRLLQDVIRNLCATGEWKVLVLDHLSSRVISSCCKMHDIVDAGITIVEDVRKVRQPLPQFEAIYILTPEEQSVNALVEDFSDGNLRYKGAHVFLTEVCPDALFGKIGKIAKFVKTLKEINIAFLPYESQVFSLDMRQAFYQFYSPDSKSSVDLYVTKTAQQLATLCATLGEYPSIRYRRDGHHLAELANAVQEKLVAYKADDPTLGEGPQKNRSQLLLLDRGFDPVSPLLHELTFQAMAYDLLHLENDVYKFISTSTGSGIEKEAELSDNDELWVKLRHSHIADVLRKIHTQIKDFAVNKRMSQTSEKTTLKDLQVMMKKMPQYQKELNKYILHLHLAEDCMKHYKETADKLCGVEQDLATGVDKSHEEIKDPTKSIVPLLLDPQVSINDKIRIILLYILFRNGISEENFAKLCEHARIPSGDRVIIKNMAHLGMSIIHDSTPQRRKPDRKDRSSETFYQLSRWVPYVKDLMEDATDERLSSSLFPVSFQRPSGGLPGAAGKAVSARYGHWHKDKASTETRTGPRLIVFVVGGVTFSEMRTAYEVTSAKQGWEVLIGSSHIITPEDFLVSLKNLTE